MKTPKKKIENDDNINDLESNLDEPIVKKPSVSDEDDDDFDNLDDLGFEDIDSLDDDDDDDF